MGFARRLGAQGCARCLRTPSGTGTRRVRIPLCARRGEAALAAEREHMDVLPGPGAEHGMRSPRRTRRVRIPPFASPIKKPLLFGRGFFIGAPEGIRTPDLVRRRHTLYPAELRALVKLFYTKPILFHPWRQSQLGFLPRASRFAARPAELRAPRGRRLYRLRLTQRFSQGFASPAANWLMSLPMSVSSACARSGIGTRSVGSWVLLVTVTRALV